MRRFGLLLIVALAGAAPWGGVAAATPAAPAAQPGPTDWVPGLGEADMKGRVTEEQVRLEAQNKARSNAVEKAYGQSVAYKFVSLTTKRDKTKSNHIYRELAARSDGFVRKVRNEKFAMSPVYGQNHEVLYMRYICTGEYQVAPPPPQDPTFQVDLRLSSDSFFTGDALSFDVEANKPAHLMVFNLAADDQVYVVYPNTFVSSIELTPGKPLRLPSPNDKFELKPTPLEGNPSDIESLRVIATRTPVAPPKTDKGKPSLSVVAFMDWLYNLPPGQWTEAESTYTVVKRGGAR